VGKLQLLVNDPKNRHFNEVEDLGVALRTIQGEEQLHIGLLYKIEDEVALLLNLRHHLDLRNETPSENYRWLQLDLDEINRRNLVALCRLIANKCKNIPFGFTYNGVYFTHSGDYVSRDLGHGLTCATFVMAVFATYSIPVLKFEEWYPRPGESFWQTGQVRVIGARFGQFIAGAVAEHIGNPRFLPEEVAAGAVSADRPLGLREAEALGRRIKRDLLRSYGGVVP
jgi:hypothetical protein